MAIFWESFADQIDVKIIEKSIQEKIDLIIFDDGLQDKYLNYDIQFVCFDSDTWVGNGRLIPSGPLRENLSSLKKYDAVFLKTHNKNNVDDLIHSIKTINHQIKIFKVFYKILNPDQFDLNEKYFAFSGIGNPSSFEDLLLKNNLITVKSYYSDFELQEYDRIAQRPKMGDIYKEYIKRCFKYSFW